VWLLFEKSLYRHKSTGHFLNDNTNSSLFENNILWSLNILKSSKTNELNTSTSLNDKWERWAYASYCIMYIIDSFMDFFNTLYVGYCINITACWVIMYQASWFKQYVGTDRARRALFSLFPDWPADDQSML